MSENPARHLSTAADEIRAFTHASMWPGEGWEWAPHSDVAASGLSYLTGMLEQAIAQAIVPARQTHQQGRLRIDTEADPHQAYAELVAAQEEAAGAARTLNLALQRMHNLTAQMGVDTTGLWDDEDEDDA